MGLPPIPTPAPTQAGGTDPAGDPSMDDILASIRRILNDDEKPKDAPPPDNVLVLDASMLVQEPASSPPASSPPAASPSPTVPAPEISVPSMSAPSMQAQELSIPMPEPATPQPFTPLPLPLPSPDPSPAPEPSPALVAPEAAAAAASSVSALMRTLATERSTAVHRGGPTLEDLVREEMRPLLKHWLDTHLPPLVERLVRAEIERVVSRMAN